MTPYACAYLYTLAITRGCPFRCSDSVSVSSSVSIEIGQRPIKQLRTRELQFGLKGGPFGVAPVTQHPSDSHDALHGSARSGLLRRPNRQRVHQLVNGVQVLRRYLLQLPDNGFESGHGSGWLGGRLLNFEFFRIPRPLLVVMNQRGQHLNLIPYILNR